MQAHQKSKIMDSDRPAPLVIFPADKAGWGLIVHIGCTLLHFLSLLFLSILIREYKRENPKEPQLLCKISPLKSFTWLLCTESVSAFFLVSILDPGRPCVALGQILLIIVLEIFAVAFVLCAFQQLEH